VGTFLSEVTFHVYFWTFCQNSLLRGWSGRGHDDGGYRPAGCDATTGTAVGECGVGGGCPGDAVLDETVDADRRRLRSYRGPEGEVELQEFSDDPV